MVGHLEESSEYNCEQQPPAVDAVRRAARLSYPASSPHLNIVGELIEEQLKRSEETLRLACEGADVGIWRRDVATGKEVWSRKYYELYAFKSDVAPSFENWLTAVHPDDREHVLGDQRRMHEQRLTQLQNEFRINHPSGVRWIREIGRTFYDHQGRQTEMVGIAIDITQRKRWEEEMRGASKRKDEFLSMLAHELRNSLSVIVSALNLSKRGGKPTDWTDALIRTKVKSLTRLIGDLLDLARLTEGKAALNRQPLNATSIIGALIEQAKLLFQAKAQTFTIEGSSNEVFVNVDAVRFEQMLTNIIHNACKYTPVGGSISVYLREEFEQVVISVRDNGIGIEPGSLRAIFDLYTQLNPRSNTGNLFEGDSAGLGIGLSVVKQLIDMHGGEVEARSEGRGKGSEFILWFPKETRE